MVTRYTPIDPPIIYPRDENGNPLDMLPYMRRVAQNLCPELNDWSDSAPNEALMQAVDWRNREAIYQINKLPGKFSLEMLKLHGVMRRLGSPAKALLTFTLTSSLNLFVLSAGYIVRTSNGLEFTTDEDLIINNAASGRVLATSVGLGKQYNVAAGTITGISETRAYLQSVTNEERSAEGADEETDLELIERGFAVSRRRGILVSQSDFEEYTREILGPGSVAKVVGLLTPDKTSRQAGYVHIFGLNPDGSQLTEAQIVDLQNGLSNGLPVFLQGVKTSTISQPITVSTIELMPLEAYIVATLRPGDNPEVRARTIYQELGEYLQPGKLEPGKTISRNNIVTLVTNCGVEDVQAVSFHVSRFQETTQDVEVETFLADIPLPNEWTTGYLLGAAIDLVDPTIPETYQLTFGDGGDLD